jgi:hypothetical protein
MDVHDCDSVSKGQPLLPANIITIEPGLYIPVSDTRKHWTIPVLVVGGGGGTLRLFLNLKGRCHEKIGTF